MRLAPALLLLLLAPGAAVAGPSWTRTRTEHFTLVGNARPEVTTVAARELERFRTAIEAATPLRFGPGPRTLHVFKNARGLRRAAGTVPDAGQLEGLSVHDDSGTVLLALADSPRGGLERMRHELVHALLEDRRLPLWLGEGMAQYLSFLEGRGASVTLGLPTLSLHRIEDCGWQPLSSLLRMEAYPRTEAEVCAFYLESALLVQYLAEREQGIPGLFALLDGLHAGEPPEASLRARYAIDLASFDGPLRAWAEASRNAARVRLPVPAPATVAQVVTVDRVPRLEALLYTADLELAFDDSPEAAETYRKALRIAPDNLLAVSGLGIALAGTKDNAEAIALIERCQAAGYARAGLAEAYAVALVGRGFERGGTGLREDHRKVRQLALSLDARRPQERVLRSVLVGVASLADASPEAVAVGRAALEDGVRRGVPLPVVAPGLLIFAAREGNAREQARLQASVVPDRDFRRMALAVARSLRESARVRPALAGEAARVEALARR